MAKSNINNEIAIAVLRENQVQNQKDHDFIRAEINEIKESLNCFIKSADEKYAPRWVANIVYAVVVAIIIFLGQQVIVKMLI